MTEYNRCPACSAYKELPPIRMCQQCWNSHGHDKQPCALQCGCHEEVASQENTEATEPQKASRAIDRLRGPSAIDRLIAGLDRDAEQAAGRLKGVLSLCGRDLTDSEFARVRAQIRAELASLLVKANAEMGQEFFDVIAARGVSH
jgi:hypothetical protein